LAKPGKLQAIGIMNLVDGILNCLWGFFLMVFCFFLVITILIGLYSILVGILELLNSQKFMPDPIKTDKPAKNIAIMEIINIITLNPIPFVVGVLSLVFYNDDEVVDYFAALKGKESA
jgi:hypothetical protein